MRVCARACGWWVVPGRHQRRIVSPLIHSSDGGMVLTDAKQTGSGIVLPTSSPSCCLSLVPSSTLCVPSFPPRVANVRSVGVWYRCRTCLFERRTALAVTTSHCCCTKLIRTSPLLRHGKRLAWRTCMRWLTHAYHAAVRRRPWDRAFAIRNPETKQYSRVDSYVLPF